MWFRYKKNWKEVTNEWWREKSYRWFIFINAYKWLYKFIWPKKANIYTSYLKRWQNGVKVLLNLFQKQQEEIKMSNKVIDKRNEEKLELALMCLEKDKIIDEMVEKLSYVEDLKLDVCVNCKEDCRIPRNQGDCIKTDCIKEYFKKKVEE